MTEKEVIKILKDIRAAKKIEPEIKAQLSRMIEECALIEPLPGRMRSLSAEQVLVICEERQEAYARLLERIYGNESILSLGIESLTSMEQRVLRLFYLKAYSLTRIGTELGYTKDGVKSIKRRAVKKMVVYIKKAGD